MYGGNRNLDKDQLTRNLSLPSIASRNAQGSRIPSGAQGSPASGVSKYRNEIIIHPSNNTADKSMAKLHN